MQVGLGSSLRAGVEMESSKMLQVFSDFPGF